jgi:Rubredoxin-like zinc ribbon domain (DUF35_N)
MAEVQRPLPDLTEEDTHEFWAATKGGRLTYQQCAQCDTVVFYPRRHCTGCTSGQLEWKTAKGTGTIYTYSVVRQSYHLSSARRFPTWSPGSISTKVRALCPMCWVLVRQISVWSASVSGLIGKLMNRCRYPCFGWFEIGMQSTLISIETVAETTRDVARRLT